MYAQVIIDINTKKLNRFFDYKIPSYLKNFVKKGSRVVVDFNNRKRLAYVINIVEASLMADKEVLYVMDEEPILSKSQFKLVEAIQTSSFSSYIDAFNTVIPSALHVKYDYLIKVKQPLKLPNHLIPFVKEDTLSLDDIPHSYYQEINKLSSLGILEKETKLQKKGKVRYHQVVFLNTHNQTLTNKQKEITKRLTEPTPLSVLLEEGYSKDIIYRLISKNVLVTSKKEYFEDVRYHYQTDQMDYQLTDDQQKAIKRVTLNSYRRYLLFGPPASGKTEVYLHLIKRVLEDHKQALIMVPEIALIPQMVSRIQKRFSHEIAIFHSDLSQNVRYEMHRKIKRNEARIIIGTRSSIFAPFNNLGIIILDEAHDMSYIQKNMPYYDAKELSSLLGKAFNIPVLYGSATPTINLMYEQELGMIELLKLNEPIYKSTHHIKLIDMREELIKGNTSIFSKDLEEAIKDALMKNNQIIMLVNRRGYAPFMLCRSCGHVEACPNCDISLVYHQDKNALLCHHCGYKKAYIQRCQVCQSDKVKPVGFGTQQVEEALKERFKNIRVIRLDQDTTQTKNSHDILLSKFQNHEADVLLGTQMVSKGHDFKNVTLIAVLLADQMLHLDSYLSNEKTYNLLKQTIGRLRGVQKGTSIIQAYNTDHFVLKSILYDDFNLYYDKELSLRKLLKYMPFYQLIKITFKGLDEAKTIRELTKLKNRIIARNSQISIIGPTEEYISFINNRYHYSILIKAPRHTDTSSLLGYIDKRFYEDYLINIDQYPDMI